MSETLQIWLFGGAYALGIANILFCFNINNKLIRFETMVEILGKKAAKQLHSPDNHHGLDEYLDMYIDKHYDMSQAEWETLKQKCEAIEHDGTSTANEKSLAAFIVALCVHKLMAYGVKPAVRYSTHDDNIKH